MATLTRPSGLALVVSATRDAPGTARRALDRLPQLDRDTRTTLKLLVSELVANSVRHAGLGANDPIHITVDTEPAIRVTITDGGPGIDPSAIRAARDGREGFGLLIVERAATRWGVARNGQVWFELGP